MSEDHQIDVLKATVDRAMRIERRRQCRIAILSSIAVFVLTFLVLVMFGCAPSTSWKRKYTHEYTKERLCERVTTVVHDDWDTPWFHEYVRVAVTFWNDHAGRKILHYEPRFVHHPGSTGTEWISVAQATVDDRTGWSDTTEGRTHRHYRGAGQTRCISGARVRVETNGFDPSRDEVLFNVIHELGHAIGISGHSWEKGTILFHRRSERSVMKLGNDTTTALRKLYGEKK